jgi:glyoxalase family protein
MNDNPTSVGIHHVTAIAGDPQSNLDFYAGVLAMRLVKTTVNFDDPGTYHLYYGDEAGQPGTILTFFPWPGARPGRPGSGETSSTGLTIPAGSLGWWRDRLTGAGIDSVEPQPRFGQEVLTLRDPHGLELDLIEEVDSDRGFAWSDGTVPERHAIRGFHGVSLSERRPDRTVDVIENQLGWVRQAEEGDRIRFAAPGSGPGRFLDVVIRPAEERAQLGAGSVHHVAFRAASDSAQAGFRRSAISAGLHVSPVLDRQYFRSIYFREPGGVLFEVATDAPGFTTDEGLEALGEALCLPPWLEGRRVDIERELPEINRPISARGSCASGERAQAVR